MSGSRLFPVLATMVLATFAAGSTVAAAAERYVLVVAGVSGSAEHAERHARWTDVLVDALRGPLASPAHDVRVLRDGAVPPPERATAENVRAVFAEWRARVTSDDLLVVVLIGHGSFDGVDAKFNLVGPDLEAAEWAGLLDGVGGRQVFVNTASSSFPFLRRLARPGRVVITATDSPLQKYDTVFAEFFGLAFVDEEADLDKDGRVSIGEAFTYAGVRARRWYEQRGQLPTERALLDDTGRGVGREAGALGEDGAIASRLFLAPGPDVTRSRDPALSELLARRDALETTVDELKRKRAFMPADDYALELERVLIELARLARRIRGGS